ncbi:DUF3142 domain-containing protein [Pseudaeromonas sp. ZJS20]
MRWLACGLLLLAPSLAAATVSAEHYQAFWLWAGVRPQPVLAQAQTLYLLQGEVRRDGGLVALGPPVSSLKFPRLWLSYRVQTLAWSPGVMRDLLRQRAAWQAAGNPVIGLQIDFDAGTADLADYAAFLRHLRVELPDDCRLSVTGLLDWSANGEVAVLNGLAGTVDELVVQTYRGRQTVTGYQAYLPPLLRLTLPFKLGLVQGGEWEPAWQQRLAELPNYRGEVVFLLNPSAA